MLFAEKGNRVKRIEESEIQRYVEQGYEITDGMGTVIRETVPTDLPSLKLAYLQHKETINQLTQKVAELEAELKAAKAKPTKSVAPVEQEQPHDEEVAKPKRSKKSDNE